MITRMYAVFDIKANCYILPHFALRDELAVRGFRDAVANPQTEVSKHPEDYFLYYLGTFNDADGSLRENNDGPVHLCNGVGEPENG